MSDGNNGYAGDKRNDIDAVEVYYTTPSGYICKKAKYRLAPVGKGYYSWQYDNETSNGQDGYMQAALGFLLGSSSLLLNKDTALLS